jgi:hypothetical protein
VTPATKTKPAIANVPYLISCPTIASIDHRRRALHWPQTTIPTSLAAIAGGIGQTTGAIIPGAILLLGLGAFLSFKAYRRD